MHFRRILPVLVFVWAVSLGLAVQAELGTDGGSMAVSTPSAPQAIDAANLYRINCQMCHGANGKALIPEMAFFNRPKWKHGTKTSDMIKTITEGVPGTPMVSFKSKFSAAEIRALAKYVRAFDKRLPPEK